MQVSKIRIVLVETSHPGNIGAVARAMKNMGLEKLYLVKPELFPHKEAVIRASKADDILEHAVVCKSIDEALQGCTLVIGTSARYRIFPQPMLDPREMGERIITEPDSTEVAIIFGPEASGLSNEILYKCHFHVCIPSVRDFSSLNLAMAVQVIVYELRMSLLKSSEKPALLTEEATVPLASMDELEGFYQHLESTMIAIKFLNPKAPRRMMVRLRRLFARARIDRDDLNLLRGMMTAIDHFIQRGRNST